jgi:hypothetical protein
MLRLVATGLIALLIGFIIQFSWTHPKRPYELRGGALGTVRAAQSAMAIGVVLVIIGVIASLAKLIW